MTRRLRGSRSGAVAIAAREVTEVLLEWAGGEHGDGALHDCCYG